MNDDWYEIPGMPCYYTMTDEAWKKRLNQFIEYWKNKKETNPQNDQEKKLL